MVVIVVELTATLFTVTNPGINMFFHGIAASNDSIVEQKHFKDWRNCSTDKLMFGNFCTFSTD